MCLLIFIHPWFGTTPRTFLATASSLVQQGLRPVFADVDLDSGCITADTIYPLITANTSAISVVHLGGWPADMLQICSLAKNHNLRVIEDCAQAHGASIKVGNTWQSVGSFGDVSAWSFCQDKILSTGGEGGMVCTSSPQARDYIWSYKDHGKDFQLFNTPNAGLGFRWLHSSFGTNMRLTEMQSAIGRFQLSRLPHWSALRSRNANLLIEIARLQCYQISEPPSTVKHAWYKLHGYIDLTALSSDWSRERILSELSALDTLFFWEL